MPIFPWRKGTSNNLPITEADVKLPKQSKKLPSFKNLLMQIKAVGYINNNTYRREKFERCEYNLSEIRDASEADSYIKIALTKYSYMIFKAGWTLKSENQEAIHNIIYSLLVFTFKSPTCFEYHIRVFSKSNLNI